MSFNSLGYFCFLPLVYLAFYFAGERARWCVLLAASLLFYAALKAPQLLVVLSLVTATSYGFGLWLDKAAGPAARRALLSGGIAVNALVLAAMKYLPFLDLRSLSPLLPHCQLQDVKGFAAIGVSYYVFQAISYLVDVYFETEKPERHFGYFALYLAFFPKLLQGPIERKGDLLPQLRKKYQFDYENMRSGLLLFTWGLFKKAVLADRLGLYVDGVYNNVHAYSGLPLLLATYTYAFQIYLDFSGYTDMALGSARLFNIELTRNFDSPYLATSVADFWRRWHITFSRWILDYIFRPLQMQWRRFKDWGTAAALLVTFLVSGLWHGASWGFVIWGALHGLYMAGYVLYRPYQKKLRRALGLEKSPFLKAWRLVVTFNLVSFAWIFFRANNLADARYVAGNILNFQESKGFVVGKEDAVILAAGLLALALALMGKKLELGRLHVLMRWAVYATLVLGVLGFGLFNDQRFIYNQF